jgi:hypothetical protein
MKNYDYWKKSQITDISTFCYWLHQKGVGIYGSCKSNYYAIMATSAPCTYEENWTLGVMENIASSNEGSLTIVG